MAKDALQKVITRSEYNNIISFIDSCPPRQSYKCLQARYPQIDSWTLWSIDNRHYISKMKRNTILLKSERKFFNQIYAPYKGSSTTDESALLRISDSVDISPALVAKRLLEYEFSNLVVAEKSVGSTNISDALTVPPEKMEKRQNSSNSLLLDVNSSGDPPSAATDKIDLLPAEMAKDESMLLSSSVSNKRQHIDASVADIFAATELPETPLSATDIPDPGSRQRSESEVQQLQSSRPSQGQSLRLLSEYAVREQMSLHWILRHHPSAEENFRHAAELVVENTNSPACYKAVGSTARHARELCAWQAVHKLQGLGDSSLSSGTLPGKVYARLGETEGCPAKAVTHNTNETGVKEDEKATTISSKKIISRWLREPYHIPEPRLSQQVSICTANDSQYGPIAMALHANIGSEYECKLLEEVKRHKLCYQDEQVLRKKGYDKTPDIKLTVPIAVDGSVINWIESKASFGDESTHEKYLQEQLWSYWNRFGPGLVIYWFGYVSEIVDNTAGSILISSQFPSTFVSMDCLKE